MLQLSIKNEVMLKCFYALAKWYVAPTVMTKTIYKQIADELLYKTQW